jgi:hypothetical protein
MNRPLLFTLCALACAMSRPFAAEVTLTVLDDTCIVQDGGANDNNFGGRNELLTSNSSTSGSNRRFGLLRFDVSSLAGQFASIDSITLKLRLRNGGGRAVPTTGQTLDIFRIADANAGWVEGTGTSTPTPDPGVTVPDTASYRAKSDNADTALRVAWAGSAGLNTADTDYFPTAMGSTATFNSASGYVPGTVLEIPLTATGFTLTEMVNAWVTQGGSTNAGLLIRGRSNTANGQIFFDTNETLAEESPQPAQLVITYTPGSGDPYTLWAAANQLTGADADPTSDADSDAAINLLEFALDGNPQSGANDGKLHHAVTDLSGAPAFTLTCPVRNGAVFSGADSLSAVQDGVQYVVRAGADLSAWTLDVDEVTPALTAGLPTLNNGWSYRTFRVSGPVSGMSRVFFQVGVSQISPE